MQFTLCHPITQSMAVAVIRAVQAIDAFGQVRIDVSNREVRIEGRLSEQQAAGALAQAGCEVRAAPAEATAGHAAGTSTCCGGCC